MTERTHPPADNAEIERIIRMLEERPHGDGMSLDMEASQKERNDG